MPHQEEAGRKSMTILSYMRRSKYFTKGAKAYKSELYHQALGYFMLALKHAAGDERETARIKEVIAETYLKIKNSNRASHFAQESLKTYQKLYDRNKADEFSNAINRLTKLLASIR